MTMELKESYGLYINGAFVPASDGGTFQTKNPATGEVVSTEVTQVTDFQSKQPAFWPSALKNALAPPPFAASSPHFTPRR